MPEQQRPGKDYEVTDRVTGKEYVITWHGDSPPTEADVAAALGGVRGANKPSPGEDPSKGWFFGELAPRLSDFVNRFKDPEIRAAAIQGGKDVLNPARLISPENLPSTMAALATAPAIAAAPATGGGSLISIPAMLSAAAGGAVGKGLVSSIVEQKPAGEVAQEAAIRGGLEGAGQALLPTAFEGVRGAGRWAAKKGPEMVLSGLKPVHAYIQKRAGITGDYLQDTAEKIADFVTREGLTTPKAAGQVIDETGRAVEAGVDVAAEAGRTADVDAAVRERLLNAPLPADPSRSFAPESTFQRIERQYFPRASRTAAQDRVKELIEDSPLSETVPKPPRQTVTTVEPREPVLTPSRLRAEAEALSESPTPSALREGVEAIEPQPMEPLVITEPFEPVPPPRHVSADPGTYEYAMSEENPFTDLGRRQLRTGMNLQDLLRTIREKSFFKNPLGGATEAGVGMVDKGVELGARDALKAAVPEVGEHLERQGMAMDAERMLDRAMWREANRDQMGLAPGLGTIGAAMQGNVKPLLTGAGLGMLKSNQIPIGVQMAKRAPAMMEFGETVTPDMLTTAIRALFMENEEPQ